MDQSERDLYATRGLFRRFLLEQVRRDGGQTVLRAGPPGRTTSEPEPLAGIAAAVALRDAATHAIGECVREAREDGKTWAEIGEAMGAGPETAFEAVASDPGRGPLVAWTCPSCRQVITDYGPEVVLPEDAEQGHGAGCGRFAALIAAWEAEIEEGGDE